MKKGWKYTIIFIILLFAIPIITSFILLNVLDCSGGLCDGPGYGILIIELDLLILVFFSLIYWGVVWRLKK